MVITVIIIVISNKQKWNNMVLLGRLTSGSWLKSPSKVLQWLHIFVVPNSVLLYLSNQCGQRFLFLCFQIEKVKPYRCHYQMGVHLLSRTEPILPQVKQVFLETILCNCLHSLPCAQPMQVIQMSATNKEVHYCKWLLCITEFHSVVLRNQFYVTSTEINNNEETDEDLVEKPEIRMSSETLPSKEEKKHQSKRRNRKFQRRKNKSKINAKVAPVNIFFFKVYCSCAVGLPPSC